MNSINELLKDVPTTTGAGLVSTPDDHHQDPLGDRTRTPMNGMCHGVGTGGPNQHTSQRGEPSPWAGPQWMGATGSDVTGQHSSILPMHMTIGPFSHSPWPGGRFQNGWSAQSLQTGGMSPWGTGNTVWQPHSGAWHMAMAAQAEAWVQSVNSLYMGMARQVWQQQATRPVLSPSCGPAEGVRGYTSAWGRPGAEVLRIRDTYVCEMCGKGYTNIHTLNKHIEKKHNVGIFECPRCRTVFTFFAQFRQHKRTCPDTVQWSA